MPSPSAPQLGWCTDTSLNPPPPQLPPSPQTTSAVPLPPTFLALLPLTSLPPSSRGLVPPFSRPPSTRQLPPHWPLAQLATPSPIPPASPSPPNFSASSCLSPSHSTSSHSRSRPTATPSTPKYQPPPPTAPPPLSPLLLLSLLASFLLLLPPPPAPNSPSCRHRVGMDPNRTACHQHPPLSLPYPPRHPTSPSGTRHMQAPEGPQPLFGLGWGPGWPPPSPTVPTAASSSASSCDETPVPPPSADVLFAVTGVEGSMFCPLPRRTPPPPPRPVEAKRRTGGLQDLSKIGRGLPHHQMKVQRALSF